MSDLFHPDYYRTGFTHGYSNIEEDLMLALKNYHYWKGYEEGQKMRKFEEYWENDCN